MTKYSDLQELLRKNEDQYYDLKQRFLKEISSLRDIFSEYLELPSENLEQITSSRDGGRNVVTKQRVELKNLLDIKVNDNGSALFEMILNFEDSDSYSFPLIIRFIDNKPVYKYAKSATFLTKEKMAKAIIEDFAKSLSFNPFSGEEKTPENFGKL
jgi:hypothetical protein